VAGLLHGFDRFARLIIAFATTIAILALTAIIMLMAGAWSPVGGMLVVAGITASCVAVQLRPFRRRASARQPYLTESIQSVTQGSRGTGSEERCR